MCLDRGGETKLALCLKRRKIHRLGKMEGKNSREGPGKAGGLGIWAVCAEYSARFSIKRGKPVAKNLRNSSRELVAQVRRSAYSVAQTGRIPVSVGGPPIV